MKVNNPNLSSLASTTTSRTHETSRGGHTARPADAPATGNAPPTDDIHLSELVRSLRSLAADSPERQARIEQIARAYADGTYRMDPQATAAKIIDDAFQHP
jgi:flagellar biosynthesis anti-sigma factor FlgM